MAQNLSHEEAIFHAALELDAADQRSAFLEATCAHEPELKRRVEALLRRCAESQGPLDRPAARLSTTGAEPLVERPGTVIGPYKLLEQIGEGGFGVVFMAQQQQPVRRKVALKVLKPGMDSRQVVARFEAERQALALMDHPNIAHIFDGGQTASSRPYFVMELVRGVPITQYGDEHNLTIRERLDLFVTVCQAVQHAHQKGIIHRDLKPSNIMVSLHDLVPVVKVIDFGIAKVTGQPLTDKTLFTQFAQFIGTPMYMSPEQAQLNGIDIDTRTDIYSLGVLLYELLTGTTPFNAQRLRTASYDEMRRIIREEEPARPSTRISTLGQTSPTVSAQRRCDPRRLCQLLRRELDWIVMKALDKDRNRRYETANSFAADVQRHLNDEPVLACPPSLGYWLCKVVRRHKGPVLAVSLVGLALVGGIIGTTWGLIRATDAENAAITQAHQKEQALNEGTRQKERTEEEAAIARAVNEFLQKDLLGQADVGNQPHLDDGAGRNPNVTVGELLDRAAAAIDKRFATQPQTEAAIRLTLGDTYRQLGRYPESERHLDRALALRSSQLGPDHPDTLACKHSLALLYHAQGKDDRAEHLLQEVLGARTAWFGAEHSDSLTVKTDLAVLCRFRGEYNRSESLLQEVLAAQTATLGSNHLDTLWTKNNLALVYHAQGKDDRAEALHKEVLEGFLTQLGLDHPDTLWSKGNLAALYRSQGRYDRAESLFKEVLAAQIAKLGPDHPDTLWGKNNLALLYRARGEYERAEPLFQQVLAGRIAKLGPDHPETLWSKHNLAVLYQARGEYDRAEPLFQEVLAARIAQLGPLHPHTLWSKNNLAGLYARLGQYARAEVLYNETLEGRGTRLGADNPDTLWTRNNLAVLYVNWGQYDRAEPLFREAVEGSRKKLGLAHPTTQTFLRNQVDCYEKMGQPGQGEPLLRELADFWKKKTGADSPEYAVELCGLGRNLLQQRKYAEAEPVLGEGLAIGTRKQLDAWTTADMRSLLGGALLGQKKHADAEPLLLAGYEGMKKHQEKVPAAAKIRLTESAQRLVELYDAWDKPDQAAKWRQELEARQAKPK